VRARLGLQHRLLGTLRYFRKVKLQRKSSAAMQGNHFATSDDAAEEEEGNDDSDCFLMVDGTLGYSRNSREITNSRIVTQSQSIGRRTTVEKNEDAQRG
jgi:hypothetical protein